MPETPMDDAALERMYDAIAEAIDEAGPAQETTFLAKLSLTLAAQLGDEKAVRTAIAVAARDLEP